MPLSINPSISEVAGGGLPYALPDSELTGDASSRFRQLVWIPDHVCVVLGQSNRYDQSLNLKAVKSDGIPVYRRPSGGEAVVLTNRMIVISVRENRDRLTSPQLVFDRYNQKTITALEGLGVMNLSLRGISDIALGEQKLLGSSIYRKKGMVFFHAVLNVSQPPDIFERYLAHPVREPDYRRGRRHRDFVTSLSAGGYPVEMGRLREAIEMVWNEDEQK